MCKREATYDKEKCGAVFTLKITLNTLILIKILLQKDSPYELLLKTICYKPMLYNYFEYSYSYSLFNIHNSYTLTFISNILINSLMNNDEIKYFYFLFLHSLFMEYLLLLFSHCKLFWV